MIRFRSLRPGVTRESAAKVAEAMLERGQDALSIDLEKIGDIDFLSDFWFVRHLSVHGNGKAVLDVSSLTKLQSLFLLEVKVDNYLFLEKLSCLELLDIRLGSAKEMSGLEMLNSLRGLKILMVGGFSNLDFISGMSQLEWLRIERCREVVDLPSFSNAPNLQRVILEELRNLCSLTGLVSAQGLREIFVMGRNSLGAEDFLRLAGLPSLERIYPRVEDEEEFERACKLFPRKVVNGFYGTVNQDYLFKFRASEQELILS